ncbi:Peroxidase, family 2-domain-containing protein [Mycena albidolilacea]|uniref:Peroxidase, family 2-domain-containing protein n=1 Tax=Mycena albidolilacea TaxID=1033008 RepID=A0AAD7A736_9AGAR|nr:Peroxidase, family 2-domain-containing protein [Mycena albidolilacea]
MGLVGLVAGGLHLRHIYAYQVNPASQRQTFTIRLANYGYLPQSGKNISIPDMLQVALAKFGLLSEDNPTALNLDALQPHNLVEHDTSISRNNFAIVDNLHFNETVFSTLANANPGVDFYNATSAGQVMHDRLTDSLAWNPTTTNTRKEFELRIRESALYLSILGDPVTGVAPKNSVQIFFRKERLPVDEGWTRSPTLITSASTGPMSRIIGAAAVWTATQACEPLPTTGREQAMSKTIQPSSLLGVGLFAKVQTSRGVYRVGTSMERLGGAWSQASAIFH